MLDTSPLGKLAHPRPHAEIAQWFDSLVLRGFPVIIPEIADYEVRREFLAARLGFSISRLDVLKTQLIYQPITTTTMLTAARFWAEARRAGRPTADPKALDGDVILAAQAIEAGAIVATENVGHISRYVTARHWRDITPP
ncbi:MAG TPA: PIN domain-containing protein [Tepidisphaeraceae bacterium]|jgi:predicted nucleic acid-binding protein|nr:PIN domain-containing protein [Tepidisphaeraceae bacterium]